MFDCRHGSFVLGNKSDNEFAVGVDDVATVVLYGEVVGSTGGFGGYADVDGVFFCDGHFGVFLGWVFVEVV